MCYRSCTPTRGQDGLNDIKASVDCHKCQPVERVVSLQFEARPLTMLQPGPSSIAWNLCTTKLAG